MRDEQERLTPQQRHWRELSERGFATPESDAPPAFVSWWTGHDHCPQRMNNKDGIVGYSSGITAQKAWQLECYRLEFRERRNEHASGTGINYAYYGWHRAEDKQGVPESKPMPEMFKMASTFGDIKEVIAGLSEKMNMNKAIDWKKEDSEALESPPVSQDDYGHHEDL